MSVQTNKWCIKQSALLEMQHGLRVQFSSLSGSSETRCRFKRITDGSVQHEGTGNTEEAAFREAIKTFVAVESETDKLTAVNEDLRKRVAHLESELAPEPPKDNAKPNGSRKKTSKTDDAVSSGTF